MLPPDEKRASSSARNAEGGQSRAVCEDDSPRSLRELLRGVNLAVVIALMAFSPCPPGTKLVLLVVCLAVVRSRSDRVTRYAPQSEAVGSYVRRVGWGWLGR